MSKAPKTAAELMAELQGDRAFVAERDRRADEQARLEAALREAEAPLVDALRSAGVVVTSAWDLVNTATPYPAAVPILLDHLARSYPDRVREGIARALAVPEARAQAATMVALYRREPVGTDAKQGLAVALAQVADERELTALAADPRHGESRMLLLGGLSPAALEPLTGDPEIGAEARRLLER